MPLGDIKIGDGYYSEGNFVNEPMSFLYKNYSHYWDLQDALKKIIFPEVFNNNEQFNLDNEDYKFLYHAMSVENQAGNENWPVNQIMENTVFLIPDSIQDSTCVFERIGIGGRGFGFTVDNAYIFDLKNKVEFFLTAAIYTNNNNIFLDDIYEYTEVANPFMKNLAGCIYQYELLRKKDRLPDLDKFISE